MSEPCRPPGKSGNNVKRVRRAVNGVLLLDKPAGITSNAALQMARRLYNAAKGGHTGTLDPLATGLLPLCFGEATKFAGEMLDADKSYDATIRFGIITDTADAEGQVLETRPVRITIEQIEAVLPRFTGEIMQVPPMHSALKRDGKPLYEYARQGIVLERVARRITIHAIHLLGFEDDRLAISVDCSKGTYIRTLAQDIGEALGCGAHLAALRRTRIGTQQLLQGITLVELETMPPEARDARLLPPDALLVALPRADLDAASATRLCHGQPVRWNGDAGERRWRAYAEGGFLGLCELTQDGWMTPQRLIAE